MTVAQLIEELRALPQEAEAVVYFEKEAYSGGTYGTWLATYSVEHHENFQYFDHREKMRTGNVVEIRG